jgi:hypothetical protein
MNRMRKITEAQSGQPEIRLTNELTDLRDDPPLSPTASRRLSGGGDLRLDLSFPITASTQSAIEKRD